MKNIIFVIFVAFSLFSCEENNHKKLNLIFTYIPEGGKETLKNQNNTNFELINSEKVKNRIIITVDKFATGGIPYYGKAKVLNDTLCLEYWTKIDEGQIPSLILPSKFKYEINDIEYKGLKFIYAGNKFYEK